MDPVVNQRLNSYFENEFCLNEQGELYIEGLTKAIYREIYGDEYIKQQQTYKKILIKPVSLKIFDDDVYIETKKPYEKGLVQAIYLKSYDDDVYIEELDL